jgi:hypothetical protein
VARLLLIAPRVSAQVIQRVAADAMAGMSSFAPPSEFGNAPKRLHKPSKSKEPRNLIDLEQFSRTGAKPRIGRHDAMELICAQMSPNEGHASCGSPQISRHGRAMEFHSPSLKKDLLHEHDIIPRSMTATR